MAADRYKGAGGIIMVHGDDMGLRLPPLMAPVQVVVVPIFGKGADANAITAAAQQLVTDACKAGIRAKLDSDSSKSPGFRFSYWEQKVICGLMYSQERVARQVMGHQTFTAEFL